MNCSGSCGHRPVRPLFPQDGARHRVSDVEAIADRKRWMVDGACTMARPHRCCRDAGAAPGLPAIIGAVRATIAHVDLHAETLHQRASRTPRGGRQHAVTSGAFNTWEMSLAAQAKFLRFLQEREFQRLGGTRVVKTNVRIVAATNRDLQQAMERGAFRPDLYYRLQVFTIRLPPLRERHADILPLAEAFLRDIGRAMGRPRVQLTPEATEALLSHTWPGNVRELRNALERAAIVCEDRAITAAQLSLAAPRRSPQFDQADVNLDALQRRTIARVLDQVRGNKSQAAK
jgi:transcriptional regulator of acetoin/glycerol metabolism